MPSPWEDAVLKLVAKPTYQPLKPKALARRLEIAAEDYPQFRTLLKALIKQRALRLGSGQMIGPAQGANELIGLFRARRSGGGFVRPKSPKPGEEWEVLIPEAAVGDAASGDVVLVRWSKKRLRGRPTLLGAVVRVLERSARQYVGTFRPRGHEGWVEVDAGVFSAPIRVGDPSAKRVAPGDKVVIEIIRFPAPGRIGEGVVTEVLGPKHAPGVDLLTVLRQFDLPEHFSEAVLEETRAAAANFESAVDPKPRADLTHLRVITIDPPDAHDFDDAISVEQDADGSYRLGVHVADVAAFVAEGSKLDAEARQRGTSVYLPGRVLPMLPEVLSNGLASLQEGRPRFAKSVLLEFDAAGRRRHVEFKNSLIRVHKRFTYAEVSAFFTEDHDSPLIAPELRQLLLAARRLADLLRRRRRRRGMLELELPEPELEYDDHGRIIGARYHAPTESHRLIEEFMVTTNEAVAERLRDLGIHLPRRIHPAPDPFKLEQFAQFVRSLKLRLDAPRSRFELQRLLREVARQPYARAIHYALLRSLKEAVYAPDDEGHYALASTDYCHFTSPIRRYPDLVVHRILDRVLAGQSAGADPAGLAQLCEHCSFTERRAARAERELIKLKLLRYLEHQGDRPIDMVITGVEEHGLFAQGTHIPVEGFLHIRELRDDFYTLDRPAQVLAGRRGGRDYRLGAPLCCLVKRIDFARRQVDLTLAEPDRRIRLPAAEPSAGDFRDTDGDAPRTAPRPTKSRRRVDRHRHVKSRKKRRR